MPPPPRPPSPPPPPPTPSPPPPPPSPPAVACHSGIAGDSSVAQCAPWCTPKAPLRDQHCGHCKCQACRWCTTPPHFEYTLDTRGPTHGLCCFYPAGATGCDPAYEGGCQSFGDPFEPDNWCHKHEGNCAKCTPKGEKTFKYCPKQQPPPPPAPPRPPPPPPPHPMPPSPPRPPPSPRPPSCSSGLKGDTKEEACDPYACAPDKHGRLGDDECARCKCRACAACQIPPPSPMPPPPPLPPPPRPFRPPPPPSPPPPRHPWGSDPVEPLPPLPSPPPAPPFGERATGAGASAAAQRGGAGGGHHGGAAPAAAAASDEQWRWAGSGGVGGSVASSDAPSGGGGGGDTGSRAGRASARAPWRSIRLGDGPAVPLGAAALFWLSLYAAWQARSGRLQRLFATMRGAPARRVVFVLADGTTAEAELLGPGRTLDALRQQVCALARSLLLEDEDLGEFRLVHRDPTRGAMPIGASTDLGTLLLEPHGELRVEAGASRLAGLRSQSLD